MAKILEKNYDPKSFEDRLYRNWSEKGYFKPSDDPKAPTFSIVIPPPNITGQLHMGHALDNTLQDILVRYKRMRGFSTLWLPGTDHASIATEAKIVATMKEEGLTKDDVGREGFLKRAWDWKEKYAGRIVSQLKKMGSSCDWSRERFTMDEGCSKAVKEVFVRLYEKGLIYRGERIINWCPHCLTSISDAEVEYEDQAGHFWHLRYPFKDGSGYLELATTRPETLLGDTAVAVNPNDERYKDLVGKTLILPLVGREIPVVADEYVEMDFGTGVVKITPAHDPNDFEVGRRHDLPVITCMTEDARITDDYPKYAGMDRYEARKAIVADLEKEGFLIRTEDYNHNVGTCYRCGTTVEPRVSMQWFVRMEPLAGPAIEAVEKGDVRFIPDRFSKNYFHWMRNIRDWCISRQLWWGHRIPAFFCDDCGEMVVTKENEAFCPKCGKKMRQDPDTLDTWFSSALWPFSTMGWPDDTDDLKRFYHTDTLVTGYDIITFWVSRMIFSGLEYTGKKPFSNVLIHGLVRDGQGRKMSKSLGNGIDPLLIIDQYGADALRFALASNNSPGNDMRFSDDRIESARNFANKIWNAARFILMNLDIEKVTAPETVPGLALEDKWILSRFNTVRGEVTENIERFELGVALSKLYDFIWDEFCDWYIELVKPRLLDKEAATAPAAQNTLCFVFLNTLKLLHPFMPFITEEIYLNFPHDEESIMISRWPENRESLSFPEEEETIRKLLAVISAVRFRRNEMNVAPSKKVSLYVETAFRKEFELCKPFLMRLAGASEILFSAPANPAECLTIVTDFATLLIPLAELLDLEKEKIRLQGEARKLRDEIARTQGKLANENFVSKAPAAVVDAERNKLAEAEKVLQNVSSTYRALFHQEL
ncbi:MAG: valine--tRNA ligase [Clostridia bacterium]|nr:valine--tRNA ligase [Clostridia bacterium]